jgi:hypothetical protein
VLNINIRFMSDVEDAKVLPDVPVRVGSGVDIDRRSLARFLFDVSDLERPFGRRGLRLLDVGVNPGHDRVLTRTNNYLLSA